MTRLYRLLSILNTAFWWIFGLLTLALLIHDVIYPSARVAGPSEIP